MKKRLVNLALCACLFAMAATVSLLLPKTAASAEAAQILRLLFYLTAYLASGLSVLRKAARNIRRGKIFDENFLMALASLGAFAIAEYPEAVAVMLFYRVGELFEDYAVGKSRGSISELMSIRPDYANLKNEDGSVRRVAPEEVELGQRIVIKPGERVPLDGIIKSGSTMLDTAALTGESLPRSAGIGDEILSGCINQSGLIEVEVSKPFGESTVSRILELTENATSQKARMENFITRFAAVYTPAVVGAALCLALIPPLVIGSGVISSTAASAGFSAELFTDWLYRALNFLVVSCPCALVISVPLSFFGGIGGASRLGILVKGSNYLEAAAHTQIVVTDKTGTLTEGVFKVQEIASCGKLAETELLKYAAYAEAASSHPIAVSLREAYEEKTGGKTEVTSAEDVRETAGCGVKASVQGHTVLAGNKKLLTQEGIGTDCIDESEGGKQASTVVYLAIDGKYEGYITIADRLKADAAEAVRGLKNRGIRVVMLTGDSKEAAEHIASELGVDELYAELLPENKVQQVERLISSLKPTKGRLLFVGDGINDAPVLARADVGAAMGALGSDAAIEAADVVIMTDEPSKLLSLMDIAKRTVSIAKQNVVFALGVKLLVLVLSALGLVDMWAAVFADVGVSMLAIMNAMRTLRSRA